MPIKRSLNLDVPERIVELELLLKGFFIRREMYKILFRGKGLEFDSYRDFSPDDDAAMIDWRASLRANKLLAKQYTEERDIKIMILTDVSDNMLIGSMEKLKCEYAAEIAASLAHLIITSGDLLGFGFFNDHVIKMILPEKGLRRFETYRFELSDPPLYGGNSDICKSLEFVRNSLDATISAIIIISDFIKLKKDSIKVLELLSGKFETMALMVRDPLDKTMPNVKGEMFIENPETGEQILIDPSIARKVYEKNAAEQENLVKSIFEKSEIDFVELNTDKPFVPELANFLIERVKKRKYIVPK